MNYKYYIHLNPIIIYKNNGNSYIPTIRVFLPQPVVNITDAKLRYSFYITELFVLYPSKYACGSILINYLQQVS